MLKIVGYKCISKIYTANYLADNILLLLTSKKLELWP